MERELLQTCADGICGCASDRFLPILGACVAIQVAIAPWLPELTTRARSFFLIHRIKPGSNVRSARVVKLRTSCALNAESATIPAYRR